MPYRLYITNKNYSSWSLRPWLLLRQLGIPFVEDLRPLVSGTFHQPQWRDFSPVAHVPCLHVLPDSNTPAPDSSSSAVVGSEQQQQLGGGVKGDDEEEGGIVLWESLAIVEFLAEEHPDKHVYPPRNRAAARAWARSAVAEMHASFLVLRQAMGMNVGVRIGLDSDSSSSFFTEGLVRDLERVDELWTEGLRRFGGPFLAGKEFTAVDAFYAPVVLRLQTYVGVVERFFGAEGRAYVERMLEVEGVKEWVEAALKETGREVVHEAESLEWGGKRLIADLRAT
ncbi:hypothetical protein C8A00DRAFT_16887 [Chaetomidium leptoderma]|uniref:GST N-terminal domain-containing protein n=1 Tax=Chaetomidium leptoderma TaxID=669021 RepID=A0AAN6VJ17_9PEZI|nr:hypothetical protein C8A00DRAFT_16887 [Chaetomidium leptoderma]